MNFFKNYIFKIRAPSWEKWAIAHLSSQTLKITSFYLLLGGLEVAKSKTGICKSLTRKPSYSSFFSAWCPDFKNVIFDKIHWALSRSLRSRGHFYRFLFRIFVVLDFKVIWPQWPWQPQMGLRDFFQKLQFWNQCVPMKRWSMSQLPGWNFH